MPLASRSPTPAVPSRLPASLNAAAAQAQRAANLVLTYAEQAMAIAWTWMYTPAA
jgi:hypothetical protein